MSMRFLFVLVGLLGGAARAAQTPEAAQGSEQAFAAPQAAAPAVPGGAADLAQVTFSLILVLALVFAAAWAMRRLRGFGRFGGGAIKIVADVALGAKERAVLVQVGGRQLLLGVTANQVNTLHVLEENVQPDDGRPGAAVSAAGARPAAAAAYDFKSILKRSLGL
ncbi:MAG: flagellar biosynthetic protein FliO [Steroidobacteraceae bacterium]|jgi:flagellar protein FliO/FliZ|nr:flagellar biosynthetic protein FliO [Steroidobacteraceae bacterium]